jgi:hypothetical protein
MGQGLENDKDSPKKRRSAVVVLLLLLAALLIFNLTCSTVTSTIWSLFAPKIVSSVMSHHWPLPKYVPVGYNVLQVHAPTVIRVYELLTFYVPVKFHQQ